jgi:hypothetical protein
MKECKFEKAVPSPLLTSSRMSLVRGGAIRGGHCAETGLAGTVVDGKLDWRKTFGNVVRIGPDGTMLDGLPGM